MCNFYHYTDDEGARKIIRSGTIQASLKNMGSSDAAYGNGVYLTELNPYTSTKDEIALNNWTRNNASTIMKLKNYFIINIPKSDIKNTKAVDRNVFLFGYGNDLRLHKYPWVLKDYDSGSVLASYKYGVSSSWPSTRRCTIMGEYVMIDEIVNGRPVYKNSFGDCIYIGSQGDWLLGTDFISRESQCNYLSQKSMYSLGPDEKVTWSYRSPLNKWRADDTIKVRPIWSYDNVKMVRKSKLFNILDHVTKTCEGRGEMVVKSTLKVLLEDKPIGILANKNNVIGILPNRDVVIGRIMAYREDSVEILRPRADRKLLQTVIKSEDRPFLNPRDILTLSNGDLVILDDLGLQMFSKDGVFIRALGNNATDRCFGIAEDENGNILTINWAPPGSQGRGGITCVGETDIFFISKESGDVLRRIELSEIMCFGEKSKCRHLVCHNKVIYVLDVGDDLIYKFKTDFSQVSIIEGTGSEPGQLRDPVGIVVDDLGNLIVADSGNGRLQIFDRENNFIGVVAAQVAVHRSTSMYLDKDRRELYVLNGLDNEMLIFRFSS